MNWIPQTAGSPPPEKRGFKVDEFIAAYGVGRTKTYEEINAGRLKARRVGTIDRRRVLSSFAASLPPAGDLHSRFGAAGSGTR